MTDPVRASLEAVVDEASFIAFLDALAHDGNAEQKLERVCPSEPFGPGAHGWENGSLGAFFDSAIAWAEASARGLPGYELPPNPWRRCADILSMGKIYE